MNCPTPWKRAYRDEIAAKLALASAQHKDGSRRPATETRAYRCPCGRWHLTSTKKRKPADWAREFGIVVRDPDGWRVDNQPWRKPITREDFIARAIGSTCSGNLTALRDEAKS